MNPLRMIFWHSSLVRKGLIVQKSGFLDVTGLECHLRQIMCWRRQQVHRRGRDGMELQVSITWSQDLPMVVYDMYTYVYTYINNIVILHTYLPTDLTCDHLTLPTMFLWLHKSFQSNLEAAASHAKSHTIHFNLWLLAIPSHSPCWRCCLD